MTQQVEYFVIKIMHALHLFVCLSVLRVSNFITSGVNSAETNSLSYVAAVYEHRPSMLHLIGLDVLEDIKINLNIYEEQIEAAAAQVRQGVLWNSVNGTRTVKVLSQNKEMITLGIIFFLIF